MHSHIVDMAESFGLCNNNCLDYIGGLIRGLLVWLRASSSMGNNGLQ